MEDKKQSRNAAATAAPAQAMAPVPGPLAAEIATRIDAARREIVRTANAALNTLDGQTGDRIHREGLAARRAGDGAQIVSAMRRQLPCTQLALLLPLTTVRAVFGVHAKVLPFVAV